MSQFETIYNKDFISKGFERLSLFELLKNKYEIEKALYLGSYIHITPSLVFPTTVYVDSFKKTTKHFDSGEILSYISKNKKYSGSPSIEYIQGDYFKRLDIDDDFDLLISQYTGFVSQAGKQYLKKGGILVANNSHGDAGVANADKDFQLIAVANHTKDTWRIYEEDLDEYFIPKKDVKTDKQTLLQTMKGIGYKKVAGNYIFKKVV